jgi:predicted dehydrogenase
MNKVRIGILGTGVIVRDFHLPALQQNPRAAVVALGNQRGESLQALAAAHGIEKTYTDFARMARDPEIDAVLVALPNYLHAPVTVEMLGGGKHVLCEKPMAMTAAEAQAMIEAAEAAQRKLMIAHVWRSSREYRWLREVVASGVLGAIFKVRAHAVLAGAGPPPTSWFVQPELAGGGAFADIGIHVLDNVSFVFGDALRPKTVFARMSTQFQPIRVEDTATVVVEYDNGLVATFEAGWHHRYSGGPHGGLELFGADGYARTLPQELRCSFGGEWGLFQPPAPPGDHISMGMYVAQIDHFLDCVQYGANPVCTGQHGLQGMRVLGAAYRSAQTGQAVAVENGA